MTTSPEKWETVKALFHQALELESSLRFAFLRDNCADPVARAEVERLLAEHDQAAEFLSKPNLGIFPIEGEAAAHQLSQFQLLAGRFRIVRYIGGGGMGEVYEAEDEELRERVAIKTIRSEFLAQPNAVARFKREVHLARKVTHPNVCRIFDLFRHKSDRDIAQEEIVFISMELLRGKTLGTRLEECGPMSMDEALPVVRQMALALAAAHAAGIVHRDFKPGNVMLVGDPTQGGDRAVVTDFGLALRSLTSDEGPTFSTGENLLGTPAYMSPEQLEGRPATPASDIYALGLVIYEMVTGARPFHGDNPMSAAWKRLSENPTPPREYQPQLSGAYESIILRCLERDPGQRFPSAEQVAAALAGESSALSTEIPVEQGLKLPGRAASGALKRTLLKIATPVLLVAMLTAGGLYYRSVQSRPLTDRDTLVLADFTNNAGDAVFDGTLKTALSLSLRQSPFLSLLSEDSVAATLKLMTRPANTPLTPDITHEVCQRVHSTAYIAGSVASLGRQYVLTLRVVNCQSGHTQAQEQVTITSKDRVLEGLGDATHKLRGELGESPSTVRKFDVPLQQATTSSLDAMQAFSRGDYERAIALDQNFALAYWMAGNMSAQEELRRRYLTRAFQLREHASDREKLTIAAGYYQNITGELNRAEQALRELLESYPRLQEFESMDVSPHVMLGAVYMDQGRYAEAAELIRQSLQFAPHHLYAYLALSIDLLALQRFDEARQIIYEAQGRKFDAVRFHNALYALAFLRADSAAMAEQQRWFADKPDYDNWGIALASDTQAYVGHLAKARELTKRAADSAIRADSRGSGIVYQLIAAQREAAYGNATKAQQMAAKAWKAPSSSQGVEREAALALAMAGDTAQAELLAQDLGRRFSLNTQIQSFWLPVVHAQLALNRKNPTLALGVLQAASPIEFGQTGFVLHISCLYPQYMRGEAYLADGQGSAAATEFRKILDHNGIVWNCWTGALAHLGLARANALESRTTRGADSAAARSRALAAYKDFLTLWNDADPEIPILKQAKAEYAKLQ
jgi:serine/threonine protein kinase/tetratricopeptide (TPR) repeat protein